jgi:predicted RNA binding protein YcfA (HicA-like mRNA interferase family)
VAFRDTSGNLAVVPRHGTKIIPLGTLLAILRQARIEKTFAIRFFSGQKGR